MKQKEIAILFFVISVLVYYIYSDKAEKTHYELPEIEQIKRDDVSKIQIRKDGSDISIIREGGVWLAGEKKYRADNAVVETMLQGLSGISLTALASESKNYDLYELDEKRRIEVEAYKDGSPLRKIIIGKPASSYRHTFVMLNDDHRVYHAAGNMRNNFDKTLSDLRDRTVMTITDEISQIVLTSGAKEMTIVRAAAPLSVDVTGSTAGETEAGPKWTTAGGQAVKEKEVDDIIKTLSDFKCDEFIEDKTKDALKSPVFTVTLQGTKTYMLSIFEKREDRYSAVSSDNDYPFLLSEGKAKRIMKDPDSLVEKTD